jgi:hypothetical protein
VVTAILILHVIIQEFVIGGASKEMAVRDRGIISSFGFVIGLIIGAIATFLWGTGLITIGLVLFSRFRQPLLGGLLLIIVGVLWLVLPAVFLGDYKMFGKVIALIFLPFGLFNIISGILFVVTNRKQ